MTDLCELQANDCDQYNSRQRLSKSTTVNREDHAATTKVNSYGQRQRKIQQQHHDQPRKQNAETVKTARRNSQRKRKGTKNDDNNDNQRQSTSESM